MSQSIAELLESLPQDNLTTKVLNALDFVVPGTYKNITDFEEMIRDAVGLKDKEKIKNIRRKAVNLYEDKKNGYQTAVWLYQTVDNTDKAIAAAAIADKVGDTFRFIPFLDKLTPKADTVQSIDLKLKLGVELIAYMKMNGFTINPMKFAQTVSENYRDEALMRMVALVSVDGVIPLGADFISNIKSKDDAEERSALSNNATIAPIKDLIPDEDPKHFLDQTFNAMNGWMDNLVNKAGLDRNNLINRMGGFIEFADDKLDYVAAFLDASTDIFRHTGIQSVARHVIKRASKEL